MFPPQPYSEPEIAIVRGYVDASRASSTHRAYDTGWRQFSAWCRQRLAPALPAAPALVAIYLAALGSRIGPALNRPRFGRHRPCP